MSSCRGFVTACASRPSPLFVIQIVRVPRSRRRTRSCRLVATTPTNPPAPLSSASSCRVRSAASARYRARRWSGMRTRSTCRPATMRVTSRWHRCAKGPSGGSRRVHDVDRRSCHCRGARRRRRSRRSAAAPHVSRHSRYDDERDEKQPRRYRGYACGSSCGFIRHRLGRYTRISFGRAWSDDLAGGGPTCWSQPIIARARANAS
jgi:hypothetical protein